MGPTGPRPSQGNLWDLPGIPSEKLPNLTSESGRIGSGRNVSPGAGATLRSPIVPSEAWLGEAMAKSDADGKHAKKRLQQERARDRGFHSLCESRRREFQ
jgi:hypothetical protein